MVKRKKFKLQKLKFSKKIFPTKCVVRRFVLGNGYKLDKRLKCDVTNEGRFWGVRQVNSDYFNKKTFKEKNIRKGVLGVFGYIK